jgi:hypothetical protein
LWLKASHPRLERIRLLISPFFSTSNTLKIPIIIIPARNTSLPALPVASKHCQPKGRLISPASLSLPLPLIFYSISKDPHPEKPRFSPKRNGRIIPSISHPIRFVSLAPSPCFFLFFLPYRSPSKPPNKSTLPQIHPLSPFWIERVLVSGAQFVFDNRNYRACWASSPSKPNLEKIAKNR